jgi:hypothetical protein
MNLHTARNAFSVGIVSFNLSEHNAKGTTNRDQSRKNRDDWAILVETTENQAERTLVRNIELFRRVGDLYRRSRDCCRPH